MNQVILYQWTHFVIPGPEKYRKHYMGTGQHCLSDVHPWQTKNTWYTNKGLKIAQNKW